MLSCGVVGVLLVKVKRLRCFKLLKLVIVIILCAVVHRPGIFSNLLPLSMCVGVVSEEATCTSEVWTQT